MDGIQLSRDAAVSKKIFIACLFLKYIFKLFSLFSSNLMVDGLFNLANYFYLRHRDGM